jgi:membrane protein DedA with SNARE-associated domain
MAYVISALLVFADGVCAIFPAETTLITNSTLAVEGLLDLPLVILAGAVGAITGDSAL